jgi:hypothetical protein
MLPDSGLNNNPLLTERKPCGAAAFRDRPGGRLFHFLSIFRKIFKGRLFLGKISKKWTLSSAPWIMAPILHAMAPRS